MGSLPDDDPRDGSLNNRALDIGYENSGVNLIKMRKVKVYREFPPGCGRNAPRISRPLEGTESFRSLVEVSQVDNAPVLNDLVKVEMKSELTDSLDKLVGKVNVSSFSPVEVSQFENAPVLDDLLKVQMKFELTDPSDKLVAKVNVSGFSPVKSPARALPEAVETKVTELPNEGNDQAAMNSEGESENIFLARTGFSPVKSPACALPEAVETKVTELPNEGNDQAAMNSEGESENIFLARTGFSSVKSPACALPEAVETKVTELPNEGNDQAAMKCEGESEKKSLARTVISKIDGIIKYKKRSVYVNRVYPPLCGKNAQPITEEERSKLMQERTSIKDRETTVKETKKMCVTDGNKGSGKGSPEKRKLEVIETLHQPEAKSLKSEVKIEPLMDTMSSDVFTTNSVDVKQRKKKKDSHKSTGAHIIRVKGNLAKVEQRDYDVVVPPLGLGSSGHGDMRHKVKETLRLFHEICRKLLRGEEAQLGYKGNAANRIDLQAVKKVKDLGREVNREMERIGSVPGVEVGDAYQFRVELALIGLHRLYQGGIDYMKHGDKIVATSIVASGGYADDVDSGDVLIYTGQGGNVVGKQVHNPKDQELVRGNLALKNSISEKTPVRVIRGFKETRISVNSKPKVVTSYTYDGLYNVERYWQEVGSHGKLVYMFELKRIGGQPELAWVEVKRNTKTREGVCCDDISKGKESFPVLAINTIDDEKPPEFEYITKMVYPNWCLPTPHQSCVCVKQCLDCKNCSCVMKNGGEFPFNRDGALVETRPLVYECGPLCKCPPSCYNRVSQRGIKIKLEIFKTMSRGWGVRSLTSISSGSFICEYLGELIDEQEAERRDYDEYLFDIGKNLNDCSIAQPSSDDVADHSGFTIDAARIGNIARFINHSCSPNLYAQNVLYDHDDKRVPHIMLFAADNIPPLQELTYDYHYAINQIKNSNGEIKVKNCYCGSQDCTGRMY